MKHRYAMILAGGKGERFWPLSTARRPKQFLTLLGRNTLLAEAVQRLKGLIPPQRILVVTNRETLAAARVAAPALPAENIIGEPVGRDTAAAIALGAALIGARDPEAAFCVTTADHVIGRPALFRRTLLAALDLAAREEILITLGVTPTTPHTGYGYIESGRPVQTVRGISFRSVRRFVEKPDAATARRYLASGRHLWNAGMFIWSMRTLEQAFQQHRPELAQVLRTLRSAAGGRSFARTLARTYAGLEKISIDFALMEKARNVVVARAAFPWDDVGAWPALAAHLPRDAQGNAVAGALAALDARDNVVVSQDRLTALIGVRDLVVVQAPGATLVCARDRAQEVKKLVEQLRGKKRYQRLV